MDVGIPIVFTAFLITVVEQPRQVDLIPFTDIDDFTIPRTRMSDLGHAGVLFLRGRDGMTKYYEYGRYDSASLGLVRRTRIPNVQIGQDGRPTRASLANTLRTISARAGQGGPVSGAYIEVESGYQAMLDEAQRRMQLNSDGERVPYNILTRSCLHFAVDVVRAAGVDMPWILDPRPVSYLERLRSAYPDLEYNPRTRRVTVEGIYGNG